MLERTPETIDVDFDATPRTMADYVKDTWRRQSLMEKIINEQVIPRLDKTNGRVRTLEKFMWGLGGGIAVVAAYVLPQILKLTGG